MKKKLFLSGLVGFIIGIMLVGIVGFTTAPDIMIIENKSPLGYEETVQAIQDAAVAQGWKVPTVHEIDKSVNKAGYDVLPVSVIELCQPDHAGRILQQDDARVVTSMMPCRVSVYETSDGSVIISRMNTSMISKVFGGTVTKVMADASAESEQILSAVLP